MRDTELYRQLLGLTSPWTVQRVELQLARQEIHVYAEHGRQDRWPCPVCGELCGLHDHDEERTWRHLDSCQCKTLLHARVPRVRCPTHGVRVVLVPWAEPRSRFTAFFERFAIDVLRDASITGAQKILRLSWDEAAHIKERAVERGLRRRAVRVPEVVGLDEKSIAKGHKYATVAVDVAAGAVLEVAEGRTKESAWHALGSFSPKQLAEVKAFAMDMSGTYQAAVRTVVQDADEKMVFDRFHVALHATHAVDLVRRQENRRLLPAGDDRLVGTRFLWLRAQENVPEDDLTTFQALRRSNLKTARAHAIKEQLRELWDQRSEVAGQAWLERWYGWAIRSRLEPIKKVARMVKRHARGILNYFKVPVTNACTEATNGVIQLLIKRARGFRSFSNFRYAVLFHCGKLELYPEQA